MPCSDPTYRQFDFWLGEWEVRKLDGTLAGTNRISKEYGGCVLRERYSNAQGYSGESLNTYDVARQGAGAFRIGFLNGIFSPP